MALTVEDGTGLASADAYVAVADVAAHAVAYGGSFAGLAPEQEAAIRRATAYLDARYGARFSGVRIKGRAQALEWPRSGATDRSGGIIAADAVPTEIKRACCESAIREIASPGALQPDYERGGAVKMLKAGSVAIEYADGASPETVMMAIDNALAGLIGAPVIGNGIRSVRIVRA